MNIPTSLEQQLIVIAVALIGTWLTGFAFALILQHPRQYLRWSWRTMLRPFRWFWRRYWYEIILLTIGAGIGIYLGIYYPHWFPIR